MADYNKERDAGLRPKFWQDTALADMTTAEWEALCDGCGKCCLNKLEDWDTGEIYWTNIACSLLDDHSCRCSNYEKRFDFIADCIQLTPQNIEELHWLPPTCAYRLVKENKPLHDWHPLISGTRESVHEAGVSVRGRTRPEAQMALEELENYLVDWPMEEYRSPEKIKN